MSQPREGAGLGNDEGDGADARAAVADVDPRGIPPFRFGIGGGQAGLVLGAVTGVEKLQGTAIAFPDQSRQLGGARDGSSVDLQNDIVAAKSRRFRGDDGAVSVFDGDSYGNRLGTASSKQKEAQERLHKSTGRRLRLDPCTLPPISKLSALCGADANPCACFACASSMPARGIVKTERGAEAPLSVLVTRTGIEPMLQP